MAREKFQTLTEQMFYILLCLQTECYGMDIMEKIKTITNGRVCIGPGTLYHLLESFMVANLIKETKVEGRKRSYLITDTGVETLNSEYQRLMVLAKDYCNYTHYIRGVEDEKKET
ncbi:MAG: PadR family transcriptional regulator [Velocimicrobium sp.]